MSVDELSASLRAAYLRLIELRFGLHAEVRAASQIDGVVTQVLAISSYTEPAALYAALAAGLHPDFLEVLATSLTVGETHFFRVTPQIDALRHVVLPDLIAHHRIDRRLRVWSAGCSTGEEAYTLAMLLCEQLPGQEQDWDIQLVATDLNRAALDLARLGVYGEWSFRDTPTEMRARYFTRLASQWQLSDRVRNMVRFAYLNLTEDAFPFASDGERIDLILCRNVTIYFGADATQRLYRRLTETLDPAAWLVLGPSDPVPALETGLEVVALNGAVFWRRRQVAVQVRPPLHVARAKHPNTPRRSSAVKRAHTSGPPVPSMDPLVYLHAGMARLGEGAPAAAIDSLRRAAFLDETSALVQFSLGQAYRQIGDAFAIAVGVFSRPGASSPPGRRTNPHRG